MNWYNWLFGYPDGDWVMQYMNFVSDWGVVIEMLQRHIHCRNAPVHQYVSTMNNFYFPTLDNIKSNSPFAGSVCFPVSLSNTMAW